VHGIWHISTPELFAAIAPISAPFVIKAWSGALKERPIWAFHGAKDDLVPIGGQQGLVDALRKLGNDVRFTVLRGRNHFILDVYDNQELYSWFLEHRRKDR